MTATEGVTRRVTDRAQFHILGPLRAGVRERPVDLGGGRSRLVLAALLLEPDRPVPVERLVDAVWPDGPPASARTQIAIAVSGLRRAFRAAGGGAGAGAGAGDVIETVRPGYRVPAGAGTIDALAAADEIAAARRDAAAGRLADAAGRFRAALARWDGPALAGLTGPHIEAGAARWDELRLTATEEAAQVDLALGRHRELVGDLIGPVGEHPYRERLRVLLMLALARAGRRSEALDVYREGRRRLAGELGLEPGRELRDVHAAILRDDPATHPLPPAVPAPVACGSPRERALRWRRTAGPWRAARGR
ncbi:AfsR/SARP family transcriptional regulator [Actinomadura chibensis]|uniref:AfsR/SARP family transcriptional regulator n=1 Tax=Actinomadura chibensis TaxID=392828 RepID=A0A5D0NH26_9ACTN|nr:BTAD domain-containing putative transcriptional regulator [Actinomadura chibensis]TYB43555.1 AfsR/SARP family transcriptional regulator [Actinomadura chibensis]